MSREWLSAGLRGAAGGNLPRPFHGLGMPGRDDGGDDAADGLGDGGGAVVTHVRRAGPKDALARTLRPSPPWGCRNHHGEPQWMKTPRDSSRRSSNLARTSRPPSQRCWRPWRRSTHASPCLNPVLKLLKPLPRLRQLDTDVRRDAGHHHQQIVRWRATAAQAGRGRRKAPPLADHAMIARGEPEARPTRMRDGSGGAHHAASLGFWVAGDDDARA